MKFHCFILTLLLASLYAHSEYADSANGAYCLDLGEKRLGLLLVGRANDLLIRTSEGKPILCKSPYDGYSMSTELEFKDKSGKSVMVFTGSSTTGIEDYGDGCGCIFDAIGDGEGFPDRTDRGGQRAVRDTLPREIPISVPENMYGRVSKISPKEKEALFKSLSRVKDTVIDGYMKVSLSCRPDNFEYKVKFRAKITGECNCDSLFERKQEEFAVVPADSVQSSKSGAATVTLKNGTLTVSGDGAMRDYGSESFFRRQWDDLSLRVRYSITGLVVENGVTHIGNGAFEGLDYLTSVTLPNSLRSIGDGAFSQCSRLTSITLPNGLTSIGDRAFEWCEHLKPVTIPNGVTSIGDSAFAHCHWLKSITIPGSVTSIGAKTFSNCWLLKSVTIPNGVTSIGESAFADCEWLKSVTISGSVKSIGAKAFLKCHRLTSVTIPNGVTSIGDSAFAHCLSLTSVILGNGVKSIGNMAFTNCDDLKSITVQSLKPPVVGYASFNNIADDACVYVPKNAIDAYRAADRWKYFRCVREIADAPE